MELDQETWILFALLMSVYLLFMLILHFKRNRRNSQYWEGRLGHVEIHKAVDKRHAHQHLMKDNEKKDMFASGALKSIHNLSNALKRTGFKNFTPYRLLALLALLTLGFAWGFATFFNYAFISAMVAGTLSSIFASYTALTYLIGRHKNKFIASFPDALDLIKRALRAGYTPDRAIAMASEETGEPVRSAFQSVVDRTSVGDSIDVALSDIVDEVGIDEFRMLAIVLVLQRDTGGSLAEVIENFSKIMRDRLRLRKKIKAITSEGKASGYLVSAIPFVIIVALQILVPGYLEPLFTTDSGNTALMIGGGMMMTGLFIIYRMVSKDYY